MAMPTLRTGEIFGRGPMNTRKNTRNSATPIGPTRRTLRKRDHAGRMRRLPRSIHARYSPHIGVVGQFAAGCFPPGPSTTATPDADYHGSAISATARLEISMALSGDGAVHVDLAPAPSPGVTEKLHLLGRALLRRARADRASPPRRLVRWRAEP